VAKGTLDERVWRMLERKLSVLGSTLNGKSLCLGAQVDQHARAIALGGAGGEDAGTQLSLLALFSLYWYKSAKNDGSEANSSLSPQRRRR